MAMRYETRVVQSEDGKFDFQCACGTSSSGWDTKELAEARGAEHIDEHTYGEPQRELVEFRAEHGLNGPIVEVIGFSDQEDS